MKPEVLTTVTAENARGEFDVRITKLKPRSFVAEDLEIQTFSFGRDVEEALGGILEARSQRS